MFTRQVAQKIFQRGLTQQSRRNITFSADTNHLRDSPSAIVQDQIKRIDILDKQRGQETIVHSSGTMSGYNAGTNQVILPSGGVAKSLQEKRELAPLAGHELEHVLTNLDPNVNAPSQLHDEARSFGKQRKVEDELNLPRSFNNTPFERAKEHSQVKASSANSHGGIFSAFSKWFNG